MAGSHGDAGRAFFLTFTSTADMPYPTIYSIFFSLLLTASFRRGFAAGSRFQLLNLVPYGAMLFDWLENTSLPILLANYPSRIQAVAQFSYTRTTLKWSIGIVSIIILVIGFVMESKNGFRKK